jgi:hypothetical protein
MIGLKTYAPFLALHLSLSADAVYERQRLLVRSGYLNAPPGRGPGSGVRATDDTVSKIILSALATDTLADVDEKTKSLAAKKPENGHCFLTGNLKLLDALIYLFQTPDKMKRVRGLSVDRTRLSAELSWDERHRKMPLSHHFGFGPFTKEEVENSRFGLSTTASISEWSLRCIAEDLKDISNGVTLVPAVTRLPLL